MTKAFSRIGAKTTAKLGRARVARSADIPHLSGVAIRGDARTHEWAQDRFSRFIRKKDRELFVFGFRKPVAYLGILDREVEHTTVQRILGDKVNHLAHLSWIAVDPAYRKVGVARKVVAEATKWAKERGRKGIWLDTSSMRSFWEKMGFVSVAQEVIHGKERNLMLRKFK